MFMRTEPKNVKLSIIFGRYFKAGKRLRHFATELTLSLNIRPWPRNVLVDY